MKKSPPVLKQFINFWSLCGHPPGKKEWSLEKKFEVAKKAGFDAVGGPPDLNNRRMTDDYGFSDYICYIDANAKSYKERLEAAKAVRPARINVQVCNHDTPPKEAVALWLKVEKLAEKMGLTVDLEVHRDTCTETPEKVYEIAVLYKKATGRTIRFCWDFSHIGVVKHLNPPYAKYCLARPDLIQPTRQFHFRPFNGHHCQIPVTDGKGNEIPDIKPYFEFLDALLGCWMKGAKGGEIVYVCPETGGYNAGGYGLPCFPNIWEDTLRVQAKTAELWKKHLKSFKG
jgi:hypothetical protein